MALRINHQGIVEKLSKGTNPHYTLEMLEEVVGGEIYPDKYGVRWFIFNKTENETLMEDKFNLVATMFFNKDIYGDVMVVSAKELPLDWNLLTEDDEKYDIDEFDDIFLDDLKNMGLVEFREDYENQRTMNGTININDLNNNINRDLYPKMEYIYNPHLSEENESGDAQGFEDFLKESFPSIIETAKNQKMIVFEDDYHLVKVVKKDHKIKTLEQLIDIFLEEEDYLKCAKLRDIKEELETE